MIVSPNKAAKISGLDPRTIRKEIDSGANWGMKVGTRYRINEARFREAYKKLIDSDSREVVNV